MKTAVIFGAAWTLLLVYVLIAMYGKGVGLDLIFILFLAVVGIVGNIFEFQKAHLKDHKAQP